VDWTAIRGQFPLLKRTVRGGKPLVYLDSASTSQKPYAVLDTVHEFYDVHNAAVHRGAHELAEEATEAFEKARVSIARLIAAEAGEIVFTSGATAAINLLAYAFSNATAGRGGPQAAQFALGPDDEIVVTELEHHSNLIPWQELCARTGATLRWLGVTEDGRLDLSNLDEVITPRTKIVAFTHASNVTGAITDVAPIVAAARKVGAFTVLDMCQSVPHIPVDIHKLGVDFAAFSGHKMFGPTGVGVLFGRRELLEALPPVNFGGSMVEQVFMDHATYLSPPEKFEAGTQMVAQAIGLGAACDWLREIGMENVAAHERKLTEELLKVGEIPGVRIIGPKTADDRLAVVSFSVDGVHPHDVGQVLDDRGIAVRTGQHCAQPLHRLFGVSATVRASASVYTTSAEIDELIAALAKVREFFGYDTDD